MTLDEGMINRRVLVVDDNAGIHEDFRRILGVAGTRHSGPVSPARASLGEPERLSLRIAFEIESATQGEAGWRMAKDAREKGVPFAMAFVDVRMPPGWDGIQTIEKIWQDDPDLQVAICTASSDDSWQVAIERLGKLDQLLILKKPFDPVEARQVATSLTHKWSLAEYARQYCSESRVKTRVR